MDILEIVIRILAGCGAFLLGFKVLSDNMEKIAGNGLKQLFNKTSDKRMVNVGMGMVTTAVVQSSSITTVMVVGFVNAGIMTLYQATAIIMGANIGTTITAQIAALQAFDIDLIFMAMLFLGVFIELFAKKDRIKSVGLALAGLGLVFVGLGLMSDPMASLKTNPAVTDFLSSVNNPILLLFVGVGLTAIIQSSSAVTTIVISMASAGLIIGGGGNSALFIILGSNIGTCVTALISSIGTSVNARRASIIHLLFNVIGSVIFAVILLCWRNFSEVTLERWFSSPSTQIAMFHTIFNVTCTLLFLPFAKGLVFLATKLVLDKKMEEEKDASDFVYMDKRFLSTPSVAIGQLKKETFRMADMAMDSLRLAFTAFIQRDTEVLDKVTENNETVAKLGGKISEYLVQVSAGGSTLSDERQVNALHNTIGDISRVAELADNFTKYTKKEVKENLVFSEGINAKLEEMHTLLHKQYELVKKIVVNGEISLTAQSDELEEDIDGMRRELVAEHITRLAQGKCRPENNTVFINLVCNLERVGDHLNFIAHNGDN
ncbi:MAG: Na/Pi cotransporter family protein [Clostridiales bacterium]|nr:Na/Pi cotransporter family protein [Clostridiales bacterium]